MSLCAKFQLSSWSRSAWKVCCGVVGWGGVVGNMWVLCLTQRSCFWVALSWVELGWVLTKVGWKEGRKVGTWEGNNVKKVGRKEGRKGRTVGCQGGMRVVRPEGRKVEWLGGRVVRRKERRKVGIWEGRKIGCQEGRKVERQEGRMVGKKGD